MWQRQGCLKVRKQKSPDKREPLKKDSKINKYVFSGPPQLDSQNHVMTLWKRPSRKTNPFSVLKMDLSKGTTQTPHHSTGQRKNPASLQR